MKLITAFPTYHSVPAAFFTRWMGMNKPNVVGNITVDAVYLPLAMEMIVAEALQKQGWDRLVIMESDTIPPLDAFERIDQYGDVDIAGSMYFHHDKPHAPMVYMQEPVTRRHNPLTPQTVKAWVEDPALHPCDGVGFGFTSIARRVLEQWDPQIPMFHTVRQEIDLGSHDLWFCYQARKQGFKVYVDSGILCDHLTQVPIGYSHNQSCAHMLKGATIVPFGGRALLNVGSGGIKLEGYAGWTVDTLDVDPAAHPTFVMDARHLLQADAPSSHSYDAVYCSHALEHFESADVPSVLGGFRRVLKPSGTVHIRVPDVASVQGKAPEEVLYVSQAGPITVKDLLEGHQEMSRNNEWMRHRTGFTESRLREALAGAGFSHIDIQHHAYELEAKASH